ncbi:pyruvate/2-oxoglutarate dehydrogenase complex dihydrolipoamide dehydrogenase (E3) component [Arthrobacter sp. CAN_A214]|uniref:dihydrolipoyl dehydrogenase family protein n=1 Tax=Arthrobacter sp. CAN_A214 TaxID=2787720 RepID=UPI0018CB87FA
MGSKDGIIDLLVVGGGTAGIVGAKTAARLGADTVLVEYSRTGGDCLWTGCIPSKTLLSAAGRSVAERALGASGTAFAEVRARIAEAIAAIEPDDSPASLEAVGASVVTGTVRFTAPGLADVDGKVIRFRQALIATGSAPLVPPIPGLDEAPMVTSETVWDLEELPQRLMIIGGGPIACELGQAFARLGSAVVMLVRSEILPKEDRDAAALVRASLQKHGVEIVEGAEAESVTTSQMDGDSNCERSRSIVHTSDGRAFDADVILVATGRKARTEGLGLEHVGVERNDAGHVVVDAGMRTSNPRFWAAGDVTPHPDFTHLAGVYASTAASNAVLGVHRSVSTIVPRVTFTSPEVAVVGLTTADGKDQITSTIQHAQMDRAITEEQTSGFTRLVIGKGGRILGGTIVGPRAGESLAELTLAVHQKLTTRDLAGVTHPYPTYSDALWNAAIADARTALDSTLVRTAMTGLVRFTRWRNRRS